MGRVQEKVAFLEANKSIVERTERLLREQIETDQVIVRQVGVRTIEKEVRQLIREGVQAIIARGGTYQDLAVMEIGIPVVRLVISPSDVLLALGRAARDCTRIILILHRSIAFEPDDYQELIHVPVERRSYTGIDELEQILKTIHLDEYTVVVGSGAIKELSAVNDIDFVNILVQDNSIMQAYLQTRSCWSRSVRRSGGRIFWSRLCIMSMTVS